MNSKISKVSIVILALIAYSCGNSKSQNAEIKPDYLDSVLNNLSVELFDNCMSYPTTIMSPFQEIPNVPSKGSIKFDGKTKELNIQTSYYNTNSDVFIQNLSFETMLGKVSDIKVEKYKVENTELPCIKAKWKSNNGNNVADVVITPVIIDGNNSGKKGYIEYYVGTNHWSVMGYNQLEQMDFLKNVQFMCELTGLDFNNLKPLIEESGPVNSESASVSPNQETEAYYTIKDPDGYTNVRKEKSSSSEILFEITEGEKFKVLDKNGSWWKIDYNGQIGYVHSSRVVSL